MWSAFYLGYNCPSVGTHTMNGTVHLVAPPPQTYKENTALLARAKLISDLPMAPFWRTTEEGQFCVVQVLSESLEKCS